MSFISTFKCHLAPQGQRWIQFHGGGVAFVVPKFPPGACLMFFSWDSWPTLRHRQSVEPGRAELPREMHVKTKRTPHFPPRSAEEPPKGPVSSVDEKDIWPEPGGTEVHSLGLQSVTLTSLRISGKALALYIPCPIQKRHNDFIAFNSTLFAGVLGRGDGSGIYEHKSITKWITPKNKSRKQP